MKIINKFTEDFHVHSINFSDGWNTVDEMVKYAGEIGKTKLIFCDHSEASREICKFSKKTHRSITKRWKNVHNDVEVIFGVEADLINLDGDICDYIDNEIKEDFMILSYHKVFEATSKETADAFIKAIQRFHEKIDVIGHICYLMDSEDVLRVILEANKYNIPVELNGKQFIQNPKEWQIVMDNANQICINSDAHVLVELKETKKKVYEILNLKEE